MTHKILSVTASHVVVSDAAKLFSYLSGMIHEEDYALAPTAHNAYECCVYDGARIFEAVFAANYSDGFITCRLSDNHRIQNDCITDPLSEQRE
jgi:hypothetical protein